MLLFSFGIEILSVTAAGKARTFAWSFSMCSSPSGFSLCYVWLRSVLAEAAAEPCPAATATEEKLRLLQYHYGINH